MWCCTGNSRFLSCGKWLNGVVGGRPRVLVPQYTERRVELYRRSLTCTSPYVWLGTFRDSRGSLLLSRQHDGSLLGGPLLFIDCSFPVYGFVVVYLVTALCVVLLHETAGQGGENGERAMMQ